MIHAPPAGVGLAAGQLVRSLSQTDDGRRNQGGASLLALALTASALAMERTNIVPAFPTIERDLHAPTTWTAWLLTGALILSCVAAPAAGKLGDKYGKARFLFISVLILFLGDVAAAAAPNIWLLIVFRSLQGLGGGLLALTFSLLRDQLPEERVRPAIGVVTGAFGIGGAVGYSSSGFIAETLGWRYLIWVGAFLLLVALVLVRVGVHESDSRSDSAFDVPGMILFGTALTSLLTGLTQSAEWGWLSAPTVLLFVTAAALFAGYVWRELHTEEPLLDLHVLASPTVLFTNAGTVLAGYAYFGMLILVPRLAEAPNQVPTPLRPSLHYGLGFSQIGVGLLLMPVSIGILVGAPLAGALGRTLAPKWTFSAGMGLLAAGMAVLALWHGTAWTVATGVCLTGLGFGAVTSTGGAVVSQAVDATRSGVATAMNTDARLIGGGIGGQVVSALLVAETLGSSRVPSNAAFVSAFGAAAIVATLGMALGLAIPRPGREAAQSLRQAA